MGSFYICVIITIKIFYVRVLYSNFTSIKAHLQNIDFVTRYFVAIL